MHGIWRIDDVDHSFSTQPFRIKYAKQDIPLSMMVTFNLSPSEFEVLFSSCCGCYLKVGLILSGRETTEKE